MDCSQATVKCPQLTALTLWAPHKQEPESNLDSMPSSSNTKSTDLGSTRQCFYRGGEVLMDKEPVDPKVLDSCTPEEHPGLPVS